VCRFFFDCSIVRLFDSQMFRFSDVPITWIVGWMGVFRLLDRLDFWIAFESVTFFCFWIEVGGRFFSIFRLSDFQMFRLRG